jgi:hypothetical protein
MVGREAGALLYCSELASEQGWPNPNVVGIFAQHVPDDHGELPRCRNGGNVLASTCC